MWKNRLKVLHLSDLWLGERHLDWGQILDLRAIKQAIPPRQYLDRRVDGFDYVVVSGNVAVGDQSGQVDRLTEVWGYLKQLLKSDRGADRRIMLVPGPKDPSSWPGGARYELPSIRVLEDLTLVGARYFGGDITQLQQLRDDIKQAIDVITGKQWDYIQNTPTLLVTSGALVVDDRCDPDIARQLRGLLKQLRVTLHLFGRNPATCLGPDPFICPHVALGTGPPRPSESGAEAVSLQMNSITLKVKGLRPENRQDYSNWHSVKIDTLYWQSDERAWHSVPFIKDELDKFFQVYVSTTPRSPVHQSLIRQIEAEIDNGKRCFCVSGLPGSGKRDFWNDLITYRLRNVDEIIPHELDYDNLQALEEQVLDLNQKVTELIETNTRSRVLVAVFDSGMRAEGRNPGKWSEKRRTLMGIFNLIERRKEKKLCALYLLKRIEDGSLNDGYQFDIDWSYKKLNSLKSGEEVRSLVNRYSRVVPIDIGDLQRLSGNFVGFSQLLMDSAAEDFWQTLSTYGHRDVSDERARSLMNRALKNTKVQDRSNEFFESLGRKGSFFLNMVAKALHGLAAARIEKESSDGEIADWVSCLQQQLGHEYRKHLRNTLNRLTEYGVLEVDDLDQYRLGPCAPCAPFLLAPHLLDFPTPHEVLFAYHDPHREIAIQLKRQTELAYQDGFGLAIRLLSPTGNGASTLKHHVKATVGPEILVAVHGNGPKAVPLRQA